MKKVFGLLLVAGLLASCNNATDATTEVVDEEEAGVIEDTTVLDADTTIAPLNASDTLQ